MRRIKQNFRNYADGTLLLLSQDSATALIGNTYYPTLTNPTLADFQAAVNAYAAALAAAADRSTNTVATKNTKKAELVDVLIRLSNELMQEADGNEDALISTALPLTKIRSSRPPIGIVTIAKIENGLNSGELDVNIDSLPNVRIYVYQYTEDPLSESSVWQELNSTLTKETIKGLETGKRYWIRVVAYGTANQMTVCDPVLSKIVQ